MDVEIFCAMHITLKADVNGSRQVASAASLAITSLHKTGPYHIKSKNPKNMNLTQGNFTLFIDRISTVTVREISIRRAPSPSMVPECLCLASWLGQHIVLL